MASSVGHHVHSNSLGHRALAQLRSGGLGLGRLDMTLPNLLRASVAALAALAVMAPGATASIVSRSAAETVKPYKQGSAVAKCPKGSKVIGGGVSDSSHSFYEAWVSSTRPEDGLDADHARDDAWSGAINSNIDHDLIVRAYALCIKGKLAKLVRYRSESASSGPNQQGVATAPCPARSRVIGGGVYSPGLYLDSEVNATRPEDGPDADDARNDAWIGFIDTAVQLKITTYAVCATGKLRQSLRYRSKVEFVAGFSRGGAKVSCPHSARLLSGGVTNAGDYGQARIDATRPADGLDGDAARDDAWRGTVDFFGDIGELLKVTTYAICRA